MWITSAHNSKTITTLLRSNQQKKNVTNRIWGITSEIINNSVQLRNAVESLKPIKNGF